MFNFNSLLVVVVLLIIIINSFLLINCQNDNVLKIPTDDELRQIWENFKNNQSNHHK